MKEVQVISVLGATKEDLQKMDARHLAHYRGWIKQHIRKQRDAMSRLIDLLDLVDTEVKRRDPDPQETEYLNGVTALR